MEKNTTAVSKSRKKKAENVDDEMRVAIVEAWLDPLKSGERPKTYAELAADNDLSVNTVANAIREAFKRNLVEVRHNDALHVQRHRNAYYEDRLEAALGDKAPKKIMVVEAPENANSTNLALGYQLADYLWDAEKIKSGDRVACASGEGVYYTIRALMSKHPLLTLDDLTVMSVTGSYNSNRDRLLNTLLDADIHCALLADCYRVNNGARVQTLAHPIALKKSSERENFWISGKRFDNQIPNIALMGVGYLDDEHRMFKDHLYGGDQQNPSIAPIRELIEELYGLCAENERWPVWDISNYLSLLPDMIASEELKKKFQNVLDRINAKILSVSLEQVQKIERIAIAAGTEKKARAILHVVRDCDLSIEALCTCTEAADTMLRLMNKH